MRGWALGLILLTACGEVDPTAPECSLPQGDPKFIQLATDGYAVMALRSDGRAVCWGTDRGGQCGLFISGAQFDATVSLAPTCATWVGLGTVGSAIRENGALVVWGAEQVGEFGDGPALTRSLGRMTTVEIPNRVTIASNAATALAVTDNGEVYAWGCCDSNGEPRDLPTLVSLGEQVISLGTRDTTCVVLDGGDVMCRGGLNSYGEIGDGTFERRVDFTRVELSGPASNIASGIGFNCAGLRNGTIQCWGANVFGSMPSKTYPVPIEIAGIHGATEVRVVSGAAGGGCAFKPGGPAACWGDGMSKLLPDANGAPQLFTPFDDVLDMVLGQDGRGCVLRASDHWVYCAGELRGEIEDYEALEVMKPIPKPRIPKDDEK